MWHHFGYSADERVHDLAVVYQDYFNHDLHAKNLAKLTEQYIWRTAVNLERDENQLSRGDTKTLKVREGIDYCPPMNFVCIRPDLGLLTFRCRF